MKTTKKALVYVLKCEDKYKIGITTNKVEERIKQLQTGNPTKIEEHVTYEVPSEKYARHIERVFHKMFRLKRLEGEWFTLDPLDLIQITEDIKVFQALPEEVLKLVSDTTNYVVVSTPNITEASYTDDVHRICTILDNCVMEDQFVSKLFDSLIITREGTKMFDTPSSAYAFYNYYYCYVKYPEDMMNLVRYSELSKIKYKE